MSGTSKPDVRMSRHPCDPRDDLWSREPGVPVHDGAADDPTAAGWREDTARWARRCVGLAPLRDYEDLKDVADYLRINLRHWTFGEPLDTQLYEIAAASYRKHEAQKGLTDRPEGANL